MNNSSADIPVFFASHLIATDSGFHQYSYDDPSATLWTSSGQRTAKYYRPDNQPTWTLRTRYARGAFGEILARYDGDQLQYWNILAGGGDVLGGLSIPKNRDKLYHAGARLYDPEVPRFYGWPKPQDHGSRVFTQNNLPAYKAGTALILRGMASS